MTIVNLVTNGDFETGDTTGWTKVQGGNTEIAVYGYAAHSGSWGLFLGMGNVGDAGYVSKSIDIYSASNLTFWYNAQMSSGRFVDVMMDSDVIYTIDNTMGDGAWHQVTVDVSAYNGGTHTLKIMTRRTS